MHVAAINQLTNKVAGTRLVNFQASAAKLLIADLLWPPTELPGKLGRASATYKCDGIYEVTFKISNFVILKRLQVTIIYMFNIYILTLKMDPNSKCN
jgi:hypothetical protein